MTPDWPFLTTTATPNLKDLRATSDGQKCKGSLHFGPKPAKRWSHLLSGECRSGPRALSIMGAHAPSSELRAATRFAGGDDIDLHIVATAKYTKKRTGRSACATHAASLLSAWARTRAPRVMSSGAAYSSGRWLTPFRQGMKSIATGAMRDIKSESW
jgi:hypothetical protein